MLREDAYAFEVKFAANATQKAVQHIAIGISQLSKQNVTLFVITVSIMITISPKVAETAEFCYNLT